MWLARARRGKGWWTEIFLNCLVLAKNWLLQAKPPNITYVDVGETLRLNVTYQYQGQLLWRWRKDGKILWKSGQPPADQRMSIQGQGTLVVIYTTLADNGTYKHVIGDLEAIKTIVLKVIILGE